MDIDLSEIIFALSLISIVPLIFFVDYIDKSAPGLINRYNKKLFMFVPFYPVFLCVLSLLIYYVISMVKIHILT